MERANAMIVTDGLCRALPARRSSKTLFSRLYCMPADNWCRGQLQSLLKQQLRQQLSS
jgi:hypothetical protein